MSSFVVLCLGWGVGGTVKCETCETASKSRSSPKPQKCVIRFWNIRTLPCVRFFPAKYRHACLCEDDEEGNVWTWHRMESYRKTDLDNKTRLWIIILQRLLDVSMRKLSNLPSMAPTIYICSQHVKLETKHILLIKATTTSTRLWETRASSSHLSFLPCRFYYFALPLLSSSHQVISFEFLSAKP